MNKNIKNLIILSMLLFLIGSAGFLYVLKPYVANSNNSEKKQKQICLVSGQSSSDGLVSFLKTKIFGYDMLEVEISKLKKEVAYLNGLLEARNK